MTITDPVMECEAETSHATMAIIQPARPRSRRWKTGLAAQTQSDMGKLGQELRFERRSPRDQQCKCSGAGNVGHKDDRP